MYYLKLLTIVFMISLLSACGGQSSDDTTQDSVPAEEATTEPVEETEVAESAPEIEVDETEEASTDEVVVDETEEPTDVVETALPFDIPTEVIVYGDVPENRIISLVTVGIPDNGETLFEANCAGCHYSDSLDTLEAVGLGGVPSALADAGSDYPVEVFFYNGILDPAFHPDLENELELGASEVFDIIAYLMLQENSRTDVVDDSISTETEEPDAVVEETSEPAGDVPEIVALVANADPANGDSLFNIGDPSVGALACTTCHLTNTDAMLVGPGMLNVGEIAATRIEGLTAEEYLYESIVNPNDFITEGYAGGMLATYGDQYSDEQVYDIIAYLMTLTD